MDLANGYKCVATGCPHYAIYFGEERPLYCDKHHPNPDAKVKPIFKGYKHRICIETLCQTRASFNYEIGMKPIFCENHMQPDMINVASVKCRDCRKRPARYGHKKDYPKALWCCDCKEKKHDDKKEDIVDCCATLCDPPKCWTQATFGYNRKDKADWRCKAHKSDDMTDVKNIFNLCQFAGKCERQANYNAPGQTKGIFCKDHKDLGMVDVTHHKCETTDCRMRPGYNHKGEKRGRFCVKHKETGMVDVISKNCEMCDKVPIYNLPQFSYPTRCPDHAEADMVDVRHLTCEVCFTQASYGMLGHTVSRCATHKLSGMIRQSKRRCRDEGCNEYACYGYETSPPLYCELHKHQDHINLIERQCVSCGLQHILNIDGLCVYCASRGKEIRMKKQHIIKMWLLSNDYNFIINDKPIDHGVCVRNRPDFVLEAAHGGHMIVLEVDENMHRHGGDYTPECEKIRMMNISQSLGQPTVFIRFNPDGYSDRDGRATRNDNPKERHKVLRKWLDHFIHMPIEDIYDVGFCSAVYLYYDGFDPNNVSTTTLLHFE